MSKLWGEWEDFLYRQNQSDRWGQAAVEAKRQANTHLRNIVVRAAETYQGRRFGETERAA